MNCPKCKSPNTVPVDENMTIIDDDWVSYECDACGNYFTKYYKRANTACSGRGLAVREGAWLCAKGHPNYNQEARYCLWCDAPRN